MTATKLSNATARQYYLHDADRHGDTGERCCYFSERGYDKTGWGFWVRPDGTVDVDTVSATGGLPSARIVDACVRAARKHLGK